MSILRWGGEAKVLGGNMGHVNPAVGQGIEGVRVEYGSCQSCGGAGKRRC